MNSAKHLRVEHNDQFGRYLVASKDLESGELIFEDSPFAVGPKPDNPVLCLGCYAAVDGSYLCTRCGWPCCHANCEVAPAHAGAECKVFADARVRFQTVTDPTASCVQLDCITPLRMLLEMERQSERWAREVDALESHSAARQDTPTWQVDQVNVAQFLSDHCRLGERFNKDLIQRVCGILEVNSVEMPSRGGGFNLRAVYPQLSLAAHNCVPNIVHTIHSDQRVEVRAAVPIKADAALYLCYTHALTPTLLRREFLLQSKFFECTCERCADPTELGTHLSSIKCNKCDDGLILSTNPLDSGAGWKCTHCAFRTHGEAVKKMLCLVQAEIDQIDTLESGPQAVEMREHIIKKYRSAFHPRHSLLLGVKLSLGQLYGHAEGYELDELPDTLLERKVELCRFALQVLDVIMPGDSRLRGTLLYELHAPLMLLARSEYQGGCLTPHQLRDRMTEPVTCLESAARILTREPLHSTEGQLGAMALVAARQINDSLQYL